MIKRIFLYTFLVFGLTHVYGQKKSAFLQAADEAFANKNYYGALKFYNEALEFDEKDADILYKSAESARLFNSYKIAAEKYSYLIDTLQIVSDSSSLYYAGEMYQRLGQYDKATEYYDLYLTQYNKDGDYLTTKAKKDKESATWAASRIKEVDENVTLTRIESDVNSPYSDFGAFKHDDKLYFSSHRFLEEKPFIKPAREVGKLMEEKEGSVNPIDNVINKRDSSVTNLTYNNDKTRVYYTVCQYINDNDLRCDICWAKVNEDGSFGTEERLGLPINNIEFTNTQPSFGKDPISGNDVLYFVSDRTGGKGKLDIWYSIYDKKLGFSQPVNLSTINTEENEMSPFYHIPTNTLYYSTEGRTGFGGYDIFSSRFEGGRFGYSTILPVPYNSSYHDCYYKVDDKGEEAYFSSNRAGANFVDNLLEACCFDIYKAEITPVILNLNALTYDKLSGQDLLGARVKIIDQATGKVIAEVTNDKGNDHKFALERGKNYLIIGEKEGYKPDTVEFNTNEVKKSEEIIKKLYLETDKIALDIFTFEATSKAPLSGVKVSIEDITDPENPILVQVNELSNDFHFPIESNRSYRITATKKNYGTVTENLDTRGLTGKITKNLYLPFLDLNRLLPLGLYFDNDEPEPDSKSTATDKIFGNLLRAYMHRKPEFMEKYGKGLKGEEKTESIKRMEDFFEGEIRGGYDRFSIFMDELIKVLNQGQKIDMTIRGYASPRFDSKYNLILGQRRINSVRNDMMTYKNGALAPYLLNKQLIITEISYGEELSAVDVIDNIHDDRGSIYSLKASKERKVEVISVKTK